MPISLLRGIDNSAHNYLEKLSITLGRKTFISSFISFLLTVDSFLPFTLLLTFLHASMQVLHGFADLL